MPLTKQDPFNGNDWLPKSQGGYGKELGSGASPKVPQLSGASPLTSAGGGFMSGIGDALGGLTSGLGGLFGGGGGGLSLPGFTDQSTIAPTVTTNQSGGTNNIQANVSKGLLPWLNTNNAGGMLAPVLIAVAFLLALYLIFRKK